MTTEPTYLVTGAMGCIGAWTLYHLVQQGQRAISYDISSDRHRLDLLLSPEQQQALTFVQGDLTHFEQLLATMQSYQVTHIIHLGALQVPMCRANPVLGAHVNVVGTVNVFEAARQAGLTHVAFASSIAVYGVADEYPEGLIGHEAPLNPHTLYGVYKVANENTARLYWQDYGISSVGLRPYTVYGVGRDQGLTSDPTKAILAAVKGEPFEIGFSGLMQFQWASDVAQQFMVAANEGQGGTAVYNLGTTPATVAQFVGHIHGHYPAADISQKENYLPFPTGFDDSPLRQAMSTVYATPLAEGIGQTVRHFAQG